MIPRNLCVVLAAFAALVFPNAALAQTWHRADTHHFIIYSNGGEKNLEEFAHKAEKFDALLRLVFRRAPEEQPNRLTIYLLDNARSVDNLIGPKRSYIAGFYSPSAAGSYAVANRAKRSGTFSLDGQTVLFHEYAHHFMYRNFPVPVPAWFSEGFAEFAATAEFRRDGRWEFGNLALHRAPSLLGGPKVPIRKLLTERASGTTEEVSAFYGWSWALTHMFYRSEEHGAQIGRYLVALANGDDPLAAAEAEFGDLDELERQLGRYIRGRMSSSRSNEPIDYLSDIKVRRLSTYDSALVELTLQRKTGHRLERTRDKLQQLLARPEANAEAWYQLAELEYFAAHLEEAEPRYDFTAAEAAVDRALALEPQHVFANVLKGDILLEPFDHGEDPDLSLWEKSRKYYASANRADPLHPLPLYKFGNTYLREGKPNPQLGDALQEALLGAPEANELRYALANHYANEREFDRAIGLLKVIAGNPHIGSGAREYIERLEKARDSGGEVDWSLPPEAEDAQEDEEHALSR